MKHLSSIILSLILLSLWGCSDNGTPVTNDCTEELDCANECGGTAVVDDCGECGGTGKPTGWCSCYGETCALYSEIQSIFTTKCISCHSGSHSTGLLLDSYESLDAGSNSGAVIISGNHSSSLLWQKVNSGDMPPSSNDLTTDQINLIAQWINEGANNN